MAILDGCELTTMEVATSANMAHVSAGKILNELCHDNLVFKRLQQKTGRGRHAVWKIKGQPLRQPEASQIDKLKHARWV